MDFNNERPGSAATTTSSPSEPPRKRQRISTPSTQPTRSQTTRRARTPREAARQRAVDLLLRFQALPPEVSPKPQPQSETPSTRARPSIVLHHNVHPQWKHLPFETPEHISLRIAINAHENESDIVYYAPQSANGKHLPPWTLDTALSLKVPHRAVIATRTEVDDLKTHLMLFGADMDEALKHKERYQSLELLGEKSSSTADWYLSLTKIWGRNSTPALLIKNPFDKSQHEFSVPTVMDLEAQRVRNLLEMIKNDFKRKSGLSMSEVQDIFFKRTKIMIVTCCPTGDSHKATRDFEESLHGKWISQIGFPRHHVRCLDRANACARYHGATQLRAQLASASKTDNPAQSFATNFGRTAVAVVDVDACFAGVCTALVKAQDGRCSAKASNKSVNSLQGRIGLKKPVRDMLDRVHGQVIRAAASESSRTYEEVLRGLVDEFGIALDLLEPESSHMALLFRERISLTASGARELLLSRASVEAVVREWLAPIVGLAKEQLVPLVRGVQHTRLQVLMTGFWTQSPCIVDVFTAALRSEGLPHAVSIMVDQTMDNSASATVGALWAMTADRDGCWEEEVTK
ncbi:hypothetical protein A1O7_03854 [Cladophialophora yegresii CBS 114405]|uniref:Uncharacterized protein n=1 Tax=Cladophialophora yegresii CBS 114405 TaxID=1182544 RepID=W9VVM3_9EURO|nr:uncharacterized protein A1O7_03854 [Cladophialophora yegresii CBS 114405]EXJ59708.1 hypothetical protein A1O7_03854 [Cladophialophora yegresii CBS 114405]